jgi:hypothetical protein
MYGALLIIMLLARPSGVIDRRMASAVNRRWKSLFRGATA